MLDVIPSTEDPAKLKAFKKRIDEGHKIEPKDWMPDSYRQQLVRMMSQHAHSEIIGMLPEANWITRAPSLRRKLGLLAKVQDEAGHGLYIYSSVETLGVDRPSLVRQLLDGKAKYSSIFNYPTLTWADIGAIGWLVDGAAIVNQTMLAKCSYGPYSRSMLRICREENFHHKQGYEIISILAEGTPAQQKMVQNAIDRWWWPTLMMFGPHDQDSTNSAELIYYKVKRSTNDELRQRFIDRMIPQIHKLGLSIPDPDLSYNEETGQYQIGKIDWDEFIAVIHGRGPCNKQRINDRVKAHQNGRWVIEAAVAYQRKQQEEKSTQLN